MNYRSAELWSNEKKHLVAEVPELLQAIIYRKLHKRKKRNIKLLSSLSFFYILSGTSIPSSAIPRRTTFATFSDKARRNTFTASFSSRRMLKSW